MTADVAMPGDGRHHAASAPAQDLATALGRRLDRIHRDGAIVAGLGLWIFGILGLVNRLTFLSTVGQPMLGLSSNGLLSTLSLIVGAVLVGAGVRGGHQASTVTAVIGVLFLLSGLGNLAVLDTEANFLAFRMPNVVFSLIIGMLLLFLGLYGRVSGGLPADNPYYRARHPFPEAPSPEASGDVVRDDQDERALIEAEIAVAEGHATPEQAQRYRAEAQRIADAAHRRAWDHYQRHHAPDGNHQASSQ